MAQEEKDFCERCSIHNSCGFVTRGLESKCERIDIFQIGKEAILNKVIKWLNDQACQGWIEDVEVDKFIEKFKKDFGL